MKAEQDLAGSGGGGGVAKKAVEAEWQKREREVFVAGFAAAMGRREMRGGRVDTGMVRDLMANRAYEEWAVAARAED